MKLRSSHSVEVLGGGIMVGCWFGNSIIAGPFCFGVGWVDGWWLVHLDYSVSSGPFLTMNFEFDQDH